MAKICKDCGDEMEEYEVPLERILFKIPFTKVEVIVRTWNGKGFYCNNCAIEQQNNQGRAIFEQGMEDGYNSALNDYRRGRL